MWKWPAASVVVQTKQTSVPRSITATGRGLAIGEKMTRDRKSVAPEAQGVLLSARDFRKR